MSYYPVFLDLRGRRSVVVGGGEVAAAKVEGLLAAGARVRVVAEQVTAGLEGLAAAGRIAWVRRSFRAADLDDAALVISERGRVADRERVWRAATQRGIPVNVVDDPGRCSFIAPAIVRRGDLAIAISTGGRAPALAVRIREELERRFGPHHAGFLEIAAALRPSMAERYPDFRERRAIWYRLVDSDVLELLRRGQAEAARERVEEIVGFAPAVQE